MEIAKAPITTPSETRTTIDDDHENVNSNIYSNTKMITMRKQWKNIQTEATNNHDSGSSSTNAQQYKSNRN